MSSDRPNQTAVDYVTIVLSPVLIMGLVGSLVFFLLEVCYKTDGPWKERLQWIFFFYVFGIVLVARISMHPEIAPRAKFYGPVLILATYTGMQGFIEYPAGVKELSFLANLMLLCIVWWCAHRLTWDCTNIDEETDMSSEGLLQASGLEEKPPTTHEDDPALLEEEIKPGIHGWWERYRRYREQRAKKRTLGVWVVYFSLAALPIFGLGQSFIPLTAPDRRRFAFWLMTIYVACGLGLLLTTCFLGLRRYLRQKRLQMPAAMTGAWLSMGATLLVILLLVGAFFPRPHSEYPLTDLFTRADSTKRQASKYAVKQDSSTKGEGRPGEAKPEGEKPGDRTGEKGEGQGKDKDGKSEGKGEGKDGKGGKADKDGKEGGGKEKDGKGGQKDDNARKGENDKKRTGSDQNKPRESRSSSPPRTNAVQQVLQRIGPVLKWIVFGVLAIVVLIALLRGGLGFLANFTEWARKLLAAWRNFWANLFGRAKTSEETRAEEEAEAEEAERVVPFRSFGNPFDTGKASRMSARDLVRYTFRAVEAWARERDLGREPGETAVEFLRRLGEEVPALEAETNRLGQLHGRAEYARGNLPQNTPELVRGFWEKLERVIETPLSARA
jgi:hypothetical protein